MVAFFGMSEKVGNISFYDSSGQMDFNFTKPYSEKTAELIDREVKDIIDVSYSRATEVLKKHMKGLTELAELLLEKEVIFSEDLERIFGKRKADKDSEKKLKAENKQKVEMKEIKELIEPEASVKSLEEKADKKGKKKKGKNI
jgi:cell division protease FtsH